MIYVITKEVNDYNQQGEYFVAAFQAKPTKEQIAEVLGCSDELAQHVLNGGGRRGTEYTWYYLLGLEA